MNTLVNGSSVHYKLSGEGDRTLVILEGWGVSCDLYDPIAQALADTYRVVQFDFPGFGRSEEPSHSWCVDDYVDFFLAFMRELGIGSATLVGHSYGGRVIIKLAARDQSAFAIERLLLIDSAGLVRKRTRAEDARIAWFKLMKRVASVPVVRDSFPDLIEDWMSRQGSEDYRRSSPVMRETMVRSISEDLAACLPAVTPETLLVWGADDDATPLADGERMEREMPNAELVTIAGAGHFPFIDNPGAFYAVMAAYLVRGA